MEAKVLSEAKVYVGTYGKYNNGSLSGAWLDLWTIRTRKNFTKPAGNFTRTRKMRNICSGLREYPGSPDFRKADFVKTSFPCVMRWIWTTPNRKPFSCSATYKSHDLSEEDADDLIRDFRDEYRGQYDDEEDFAYEIIEECYDLPEFAKTYFDYEKFTVTCLCAITGLMTVLCFVRHNQIPIRAGCQSPAR